MLIDIIFENGIYKRTNLEPVRGGQRGQHRIIQKADLPVSQRTATIFPPCLITGQYHMSHPAVHRGHHHQDLRPTAAVLAGNKLQGPDSCEGL